MGLLSKRKIKYKRIDPIEQIDEENKDEEDEDEEDEEEDIPQEEIEKVINKTKEVKKTIEEIPKERIIVVKEIPVKEIRTTKSQDGTILHFMTIEEALTEILN